MAAQAGFGDGNQLSIDELRQTISSTIRRLEAGETTAAVANGIANLGGKLLGTYKLQMEYAKLLGKTPNIDALLPAEVDQPVDIARRASS